MSKMLFKLCMFLKWPPEAMKEAGGDFTIGVLGDDDFRKALTSVVEGKKVRKRTVRVEEVDELDEAKGLLIIFVKHEDEDHRKTIVEHFEGKPVLLVSRQDGFAKAGGCLEFTIVNKKIRFRINLGSAKASKIKINANLLKLALEVIR